MYGTSYLFVFLCVLLKNAEASLCQSDICQNPTQLLSLRRPQCLLKIFDRNQDCLNLKFDVVSYLPPNENENKFEVTASVKDFGGLQGKATVIKLSISDISFHKSIIRYQNLLDDTLSSCSYVQLLKNEVRQAPKQLSISCPFINEWYEGAVYQLEYLMIGENYEYTRKLVFKVPEHKSFENTTDIKMYTPFVYIIVSDVSMLTLYAQPPPENLNVTKYKVWLMNNNTDSVIDTHTVNVNYQGIEHDVAVDSGVYYFVVTTLHPDCGEYGCVNVTSPFVRIKTSDRLFIMVVSMIWIPPAILYGAYLIYKLYKQKKSMYIRSQILHETM